MSDVAIKNRPKILIIALWIGLKNLPRVLIPVFNIYLLIPVDKK